MEKEISKIKNILKMTISIIFAPIIWLFIFYFIIQFRRFPEIWTFDKIAVFFIISIPLSILFYIFSIKYLSRSKNRIRISEK